MTAQELQRKLQEKFFRFRWKVAEEEYQNFRIEAWFDAPDGQIKLGMEIPREIADDLWKSGYIANEVAQVAAWELTTAERHGENRVTARMLESVVPYLREIRRRWPEFDLNNVDIIRVKHNKMDIFVGDKTTRIDLVHLLGDKRSMAVFYSDEKKTLFVK